MSTTTTQHTQTAYKDTPIGKIPADWEVKRLGEIVKLSSGKTKPILNNGMGQYPVFGGNGIMGYSESYNYTGETVIIGRVGEYCGITRYVDEPCWITDNALYAKEIAEGVKPIYLAYKLQQLNLSRYRSKGGQPLISQTMINPISLPLPPLSEQKRIAEVLSTWDQAIQLTEQLIRQKEQRKKWLMQNLLTGKMRLKGFSGEWKECKLGSLGDTYNGLTGKSKEDFGKGKPYIPYLNVFNNSRIDIKNLDYVKITEDDKQNKVKYGDIFFTVSSETPNEVGMASVILDEVDELYLNSFCFGFRLFDFNTLIPEFSSYLLRADTFRAKIYKLSQGATRFNLSKNNLMKLSIILPSKEEQTAIAEVLQTADKEISLLRAKAEQLKEQKKGLMQQLLTGKKRLL